MNFIELLSYTFFQHALIGCLLASIVCGIIGTYIVIRRLVFISGGLTHASLGGLGIGFYFGINPILTALIFSILSACGMQWVTSNHNVRQDTAIGAFWSLGMAIGIIFIYLKPGFAPNLTDYLFGNILTITINDIIYLAILTVISIIIFTLFGKYILYTAFDTNFARIKQIPVTLINYSMMILTAVTIVLTIRLVGIVLLMSIITIPQMTANLFTMKFYKMIKLSIAIGFVGCIIGLITSTLLDVPSGVFIIFSQIIIYFLCKFIISIRNNKNYK